MFHRCGGGQTFGRPTKVSADARYWILVRGLFVTDRASWDWRWSAVADGMKLVPPDITFGAAPIDATPRTCGVVHIYMSPNRVFCIVSIIVARSRAVAFRKNRRVSCHCTGFQVARADLQLSLA